MFKYMSFPDEPAEFDNKEEELEARVKELESKLAAIKELILKTHAGESAKALAHIMNLIEKE